MSGQRRFGAWGPEPIAYSEIDAWARLTGRRLDPVEVLAIVKMDGAELKKLTADKGENVRDSADADDVEGVKRLLGGLKTERGL